MFCDKVDVQQFRNNVGFDFFYQFSEKIWQEMRSSSKWDTFEYALTSIITLPFEIPKQAEEIFNIMNLPKCLFIHVEAYALRIKDENERHGIRFKIDKIFFSDERMPDKILDLYNEVK